MEPGRARAHMKLGLRALLEYSYRVSPESGVTPPCAYFSEIRKLHRIRGYDLVGDSKKWTGQGGEYYDRAGD